MSAEDSKPNILVGRFAVLVCALALTTSVLALIILFLMGEVRAADESGNFRMVRAFLQDYTTLDYGHGQAIGGPLEGVVTIIESSGAPFVEGEHSRITCLVYARDFGQGLDLVAPCIVTAPSGDTWFPSSTRQAGDLDAAGSGGAGTIAIEGGTGAYAGISGSCTYKTSYLTDRWLASISDCTWER